MSKIKFNKETALAWIKAFNDHDLDSLLALYADDAVHFSPKLKIRIPESNGHVSGKIALRQWWGDAFNRLPSLNYHLVNLIINDDQVLMEYVRRVDGDAEMMIAEVLEIKDKLIIRSRVYQA